MNKKLKLFVWMIPAISIGFFYILAYKLFPYIDPENNWSFYFAWIAYPLHLIWSVITPLILFGKKNNVKIKDVLFSISSILFANIVLLTPELLYLAESKSIIYFDEDSFYRIIIIISIFISIVSTGILWYIKSKSRANR